MPVAQVGSGQPLCPAVLPAGSLHLWKLQQERLQDEAGLRVLLKLLSGFVNLSDDLPGGFGARLPGIVTEALFTLAL